MKVTICTMNYNLSKFVGETIQSVLSQTFTDFEYLIIDDCSTDDSLEVIKAFNDPRIKVIEMNANSGNPDILVNLCLEQAKGDYFTILPSDDVWEPTYLEKTIGKLDKDPIYGSAFTHIQLIDDESKTYPKPHMHDVICNEPNRTQEDWVKLFYCGNRIRGGFIFRRSLDVGLFDTSLEVLSDQDFFLRCILKAPIYVVQEKLIKVRIRGDDNRSAATPANIEKAIEKQGVIQRKHYRKYNAENLKDKTKLIIATPFYEMKGFSPYIMSIIATVQLLERNDIDYDFIAIHGDSYVDRARNTIVAKFLESNGTHLLTIDSDEEWDAKAVLKMLKADQDVLGGSYPMKNNWDMWSSIPDAPDGRTKGKVIEDGATALIEAECVSAGFMMVKRGIFEKIEQHYPHNCYTDVSADPENPGRIYIAFFECFRRGGRRLGEDYTFCTRLTDIGQKLYIYPNIDFGHYGVKGWYGNYDQYLRKLAK